MPESKERLAPELQANPSTSLTAKKAGELTGTSPAKIDHAIRGFSGTLGTYTTMLADKALLGADPDAPAPLPMPWQQMPVAKVFFRNPSGANSRQVTEFYELLKEARQATASQKAMPPDEMQAYYRKHQTAIDLRLSAEQTSKQMAELRRDIESIRAAQDVPAEERVKMIAENNAQIRWLARDFLNEAKGLDLRPQTEPPAGKPSVPPNASNPRLRAIGKGINAEP